MADTNLRTAPTLPDDERENALIGTLGAVGEGFKMYDLAKLILDFEIQGHELVVTNLAGDELARLDLGSVQPVVQTHTRYALWTGSATPPTAVQFLAIVEGTDGTTATADRLTVPGPPVSTIVNGRSWLHIATVSATLSDIRIEGSQLSQRNAWGAGAALEISNEDHYVYSPRSPRGLQAADYSGGRVLVLTP